MTRIAAFGCIHAPFTNKKAWDLLVRLLKQEKPDIVVNTGDWFEAEAASIHLRTQKVPLHTEYDKAVEQSEQIRKAVGKDARLVWCLGNHDDNLQDNDDRRIDMSLRGIASWNTYSDEFRRWEQIPYIDDKRGSFRVGSVVFSHGCSHGKHSDAQEALLRKQDHGLKTILSVRSHTHRPKDFQEHADHQGVFFMNVGTLGPLKPEWTKRKDTRRWAPAVGLIEVESPTKFDARLVRL